MNTFVTAITDLIKYKIIKMVDTSDKTLDSLIVVLLTLVMTVSINWMTKNFVSYITKIYILYFSLFRKKCNDGPIPPDQYYKYKNVELEKFKYWISFQNSESIETITEWVLTYVPNFSYMHQNKTLISLPNIFDDNNSPGVTVIQKYKNAIYKSFKKIPIILYKNSVGYLHFDENMGILYFITDSTEVLSKFANTVKTIRKQPIDVKVRKELYVYEVAGDAGLLDQICNLSPKKTLDCIVSRNKKLIKDYLDRFISGNLYSVDSGWIPNNLGIMLHGEPGLGKTSLIKAICNYTGRHAIMVDVRMISNGDQLEKIFRNYGNCKYIIVLEEIDFMTGILTRSKDTIPIEKKKTHEKTDLAMLLLNINSSSDAEMKKTLLEEYKKKSEIKIKKALDLSLLLQLMDGIVENSDRLIIATTNCPDMIDKALLRPGRFDLVLKLNYFNKSEIVELLEKLTILSESEKEYIKMQNFVENVWSPLEIVQLVLNLNKNIFEISKALCNHPTKRLE